ncbi:MAG: PTS sugar transporter subunit IIA [Victivallales bacterium]|nr:PTS sugar transporter subunit IIA [Victivallales bacterium]
MSLSVKETAMMLSVDEHTINNWVVMGDIPYHKVGGEICFFTAELRAWALAQGHKITIASDEKPASGFAAAVARGGVFSLRKCAAPEAVIDHLIENMHLPSSVDRGELKSGVLEREKNAATAIGNGIAVPHMHKSLSTLETPIAACGLLQQPVPWGEEQVRIVFLPFCPNMRIHLDFLMKIARLGRRCRLLERLLAQPEKTMVINILLEAETENRSCAATSESESG